MGERDITEEEFFKEPVEAPGNRKVLVLSLLALAVFLAWQALDLRSYIRRDTRPPSWDQAVHMEIALDYRKALAERRFSDILYLAPKPGMPPFPPLYHLALTGVYDHDNPAGEAIWLNWYYLVLLCLSLFAIAYYFRPDASALAAVLLLACAPAVRHLYTTQLIDLALTAWVAAAYWALLISDRFRKWTGSLLFGVLFALGMMHKWSFFSYLIPAYFLALQALFTRGSRVKTLAAAAVALLGFLPWYLIHLPILFPRLIGASTDLAVSKSWWEFFTYLLTMEDGFGPFLWVMALTGLAGAGYKRHKEKGLLLALWFASSYIFWAFVPNQQMRFLLPGLTGLAAAAVSGPWPVSFVWIAVVFQVFAAANFSSGWISEVRLSRPLYPFRLLVSDPPAAEDWKLADILREAQKRHDPALPFSNLTLVANDQFVNGPTITWMNKYLGLTGIAIRGVNRRLCEFSQFVVLKKGKLGPPRVIDGLPEAAAVVLRKDEWFDKAYAQAGSWPLPDGSEAILYQQRKIRQAPFRDKDMFLLYYGSGTFSATNLKIGLGRWDAAGSAYPDVSVAASEIELRKLKVKNVRLGMEDLLLVPSGSNADFDPWEDVRFLKMKKLKIKSLEITADDLRNFIEARVKGLRVSRLELDKTVRVGGSVRNIAFSAEASIALEQRPSRLVVTLTDIRIGISPVPLWMLNHFKTITIPLEPSPETPFHIDLSGLTLKDGRLTVP